MAVFIHDEEYIPKRLAAGSGRRIGIAITTHNRPDLIQKALENHLKYSPNSAVIAVVDDGSSQSVTAPEGVTLHRHQTPKGISHAKNKCLEILMDADCEEIFLFDDDCWPKVENWHLPYIESPEPHLAHSWNLVALWRDEQHTAFHACGGTVLYYHRSVIEKLGGMRHCFGKYGCEHVNLSDRIHNAGLTTWRYADITSAEELFYECDRYERNTHKGVSDKAALEHNRTEGTALWRSMREDKDFAPYREQNDYVVTTLLTGVRDPQRNVNMKANTDLLKDLATSVKVGKLVVLHDQLENPQLKTGAGEDVIFVKVTHCINPYFSRWQVIYNWLRSAKDVRMVWAVDGTDVKQLRDPFNLEKGQLYIGQEQATLSSKWITQNAPDTKLQKFFNENLELTLLNPGTIGGDKETLQEFCHAMAKEWYDDHIEELQNWERRRIGPFDMGMVQFIARTKFADRLVYGPSVNTQFKGNKADEFARWQHK